MHILIATPSAGGTTTVDYARSLVAATLAIIRSGGSYRHLIVDGAEIVLARNILSQSFLLDSRCTHILFIDSDMAIDQAVFEHMIQQGKPIIGAAYSERKINLDMFAEASKDHELQTAAALASNFNIRMVAGEKQISNHLCPVNGFGFGCVLIKRCVFETLIQKSLVEQFRSSKLQSVIGDTTAYDFFGKIRLPSGEWLSEDYSFCERVLQANEFELLAYVGDGVGHVGPFRYSAPYIERLKLGKP